MATIESAFTVCSSSCRLGGSTGAGSTTGAGGGAEVVRGTGFDGADESVDAVGETAGVSTTGSGAGRGDGRDALAERADADVVLDDVAIAFGAAGRACATGFGGGTVTTVSEVGDEAGAAAVVNSGSGAGDDSGEGVAVSVGSVVGVGSAAAIDDDAGAGVAVRRAITKPADATDTTIAATAAAMKRDPEFITELLLTARCLR